jgi:hypothetical protein
MTPFRYKNPDNTIEEIFCDYSIFNFKVGDVVVVITHNENIKNVGCITGVTLNPTNEVCFEIRYSSDKNRTYVVHPKNVYSKDDLIRFFKRKEKNEDT